MNILLLFLLLIVFGAVVLGSSPSKGNFQVNPPNPNPNNRPPAPKGSGGN